MVALTLGPDDAADAIKRALQMGATAGIHINDEAVHGSDAFGTSTDPGRRHPKAEPDLVICGMSSTDGSMGVVPSMIAERLGWPAATLGATLELSGGQRPDPPRHRRGQSHRRGAAAGGGECHRPVRRGALSVDEGHSGGQEEAGRELGSVRSGRGPASSVGLDAAWTRVQETAPRPPKEAGRVVPDEDGGGADALVDFLSAGKYI